MARLKFKTPFHYKRVKGKKVFVTKMKDIFKT